MECHDLPLVEALLAEANRAVEMQHFDEALPPLNRGLEIMGQAYLSPGLLDDSSLKLALAEKFQRQQQKDRAVYIKSRTLAERLALFQRQNRCP